DAGIAALSWPEGLPRHGRDVDLGDAARDYARAPGTAFDRAGDRSPYPRALARLVAFDLYRRTVRAGRQGHLHAAGRHRQPTSLAARSFCRRHRRTAHLLAPIPWPRDRRRVGDARFLTGVVDPQRMRVAGHWRWPLPSERSIRRRRTWRKEADRGCMNA